VAEYAIGLDLGQASDYTALTVVERLPPTPGESGAQSQHHLRHVERLPLGTPYPAVVEHVGSMLARPELEGRRSLIVDATGVGRPVVDLLRRANLQPVPVVVHGGNETTVDGNGFRRVPKRELVSTAQVLLQSGRLKFAASMPLVKTLVDELLKFEVKITETGHDTYGAWREGAHDDLVFALALATWWGERHAAHLAWLARAEPVPIRFAVGRTTPTREREHHYRGVGVNPFAPKDR
jgi:hypothetical protein